MHTPPTRPTPHDPADYLEHRPLLTRLQARVLGLGAPLLIALLGVGLAVTEPLDRLEALTLDGRFRFRGPLAVRRDVVVVELTENTRRELKHGERRFELREHLPDAINHLADAGAVVIGLDFWLEDLTDPALDARLADAIAGANVLLAATHQAGRPKRAPPLFLQAAAAEGTITVNTDPDGVLRRLPWTLFLTLVNEDGTLDRAVPHFPVVAALFGLLERDPGTGIAFEGSDARLGKRSIQARSLVDYAAVDPGVWSPLAFEDVVRNQFPRERLNGAIVLIGTLRTIEDSFPTPLSSKAMPGVYYHANVIAQILDDRWFESWWWQGRRRLGLVAGLAFGAGVFSWTPRSWWRYRHSTLLLLVHLGVGGVVFLGGWVFAAFVLFGHHILVPVAAPLTAMCLSLGTGLAAQWVTLSADTRRMALRAHRIEAMFGQCVSRSVLQAVQADPEAVQRTQTREVTVLFCDLRGFTAASGELQPEQVAALLNEYFNHITAAIFENDGFIDKFVGDEVMAVFSVPFPQSDHVERAVRTAVAIKRRLADLNRQRTQRGEKPLDCGVGIHTGPAAAGHIGSRERSNYTVVGHTVNLAARIEGFTQGGEILVSEAVRAGLPADYPVSFWKQVEIRGCTDLHNLHRIHEDRVSGVPSSGPYSGASVSRS